MCTVYSKTNVLCAHLEEFFFQEIYPPRDQGISNQKYILVPRAAISKYHQLSSLKQEKFSLSKFTRPEVQNQDVGRVSSLLYPRREPLILASSG